MLAFATFLCKLGGESLQPFLAMTKFRQLLLLRIFFKCSCDMIAMHYGYSVDLGVQIDQSESQVLKKVQLFLFEL